MVLKGIKQKLGVGSAEEFYALALDRLAAVSSGSGSRSDAIKAFRKAAEKADERPDFRARAEANAALHSFIDSGSWEELRTLQARLPQATWIERPGNPGERVLADPLLAEIEGRLAAREAAGSEAAAAVAAHEAASAAFGRCADHRLVTYPYHHTSDRHVGTGRERQQFHAGMAFLLSARHQLLTDPELAAQTAGRAVAAFAACGDQERQETCAGFLREVQTRRTCWMCRREFPGEGTYYGRVNGYVTPYVRDQLESWGQDASSVDVERGQLVLCRVCESVVNERARSLLEQRLPEVEARLTALVDDRMEEMRNVIRNLTR